MQRRFLPWGIVRSSKPRQRGAVDPDGRNRFKYHRELRAGHASAIFRLERPGPALWKLYLIRSVLSGPAIIFTLPFFYFRYQTLRYRFDEEGVHMKVGILFRREVNLTYARIQDIHLRSGFIQRWLGLADAQVQPASGNAGAELVIEGFREFSSPTAACGSARAWPS